MLELNKILLINKPKSWTSFDVVAKIRNKYLDSLAMNQEDANSQKQIADSPCKRLRVGHAGTLDPFATGLLIVLVGKATKEQDKYMKLDKEYEAVLKLGYTSTTGDPEGKIAPYKSSRGAERRGDLDCHSSLAMADIQDILRKFTGKIEQTPPAYSAIKINGKKAYELARAGKEVKLKSRTINIYQLTINNYDFPILELKVKCSSGTYIRTLAKDIGKDLGCGAYLTDLKRTGIGEHKLEDAEEIKEILLT